jgi:hypothetical protein
MYEGPGYRSEHSHFRNRHYGATTYVTSRLERELGALESYGRKSDAPHEREDQKYTQRTCNREELAQTQEKTCPDNTCNLARIIYRRFLDLKLGAHTANLIMTGL